MHSMLRLATVPNQVGTAGNVECGYVIMVTLLVTAS